LNLEFLRSAIDWQVGGFPAGRAVAALAVFALTLLVRGIVRALMLRKGSRGQGFLKALICRERTPVSFLILILGIYAAIRVLPVSGTLILWTKRLLLLLGTFDVVWILIRVTDAVSDSMTELADGTESQLDDQLVPILRKAAKVLIVALGVVFYMQAMGYPVSGIVAGLGIGGLAVALAAQDTLSGLFASVAIFLDRPFMVGDFVKVGDVIGTVEEIGLRSSRIRTIGKTLVTIPNKQLIDDVVDNWSLRPMRRTEITVGVTYGTSPTKMEELLSRLRTMLDENPDVDDGMKIVNFTTFAASSLNVELKFFLATADYIEWLNMLEKVNLRIMHIVSDLGLEFAFPSTSVYLEKDD
jgi:MscS family membrane protein